MTTATSSIPPGIYRIIVADSIEPAWLTYGGDYVTVDSPGARPDPDQEWLILPLNEHGDIVIRAASKLLPPPFLSYKSAPEAPQEGDRVELHGGENPNLATEWQYKLGPENRYSLHVAGSRFGIELSPLAIHPPFLILGDKQQLRWRFEFARPE